MHEYLGNGRFISRISTSEELVNRVMKARASRESNILLRAEGEIVPLDKFQRGLIYNGKGNSAGEIRDYLQDIGVTLYFAGWKN